MSLILEKTVEKHWKSERMDRTAEKREKGELQSVVVKEKAQIGRGIIRISLQKVV